MHNLDERGFGDVSASETPCMKLGLHSVRLLCLLGWWHAFMFALMIWKACTRTPAHVSHVMQRWRWGLWLRRALTGTLVYGRRYENIERVSCKALHGESVTHDL